jgi:hypothetical protein
VQDQIIDEVLSGAFSLEWTQNPRPLDFLAAALFVRGEAITRPMAFFSAYFDSSGDGVNQPRVVVSGYIANYGQWKLFEKSWDLAHSDFGLNRPFHMSEFVAALERPESYKKQKNARQDYLNIAATPDRAMAFLRILTNIQMCGVICGISTIIDMKIYDSVDSVLDLRKAVPPYALGARMCIANVRSWEKYFRVSEPVECVFEEGDLEQGKFTNLMIDEGEACPIYKKKDDFAALQGADMYAWEQTHFLRKYGINPQMEARQEFGMLLHAIPKIHTHAPVEVLINLCHAKGIEVKK